MLPDAITVDTCAQASKARMARAIRLMINEIFLEIIGYSPLGKEVAKNKIRVVCPWWGHI
jgi:hypothetical protein